MRVIKFNYLFEMLGHIHSETYSLSEIEEGIVSENSFPTSALIIAKRQFTGLTDKHGKDIWGLDIVEFKSHYTGKRTLISRVVWSDTTSRWGLRHGPERDYSTMWPEMVFWMEVIGNIYQDSHLCNETDKQSRGV